MLNFETMYKTTIKINNVTKMLKKFIVTINNQNRFKHLIENSKFFVLSFIDKIETFTFSMTKFILKIENIKQLIQMFNLTFALCVQINLFFVFAISINYFRNVFNVVVIYFNNIFSSKLKKMRKKNIIIVFFAKC